MQYCICVHCICVHCICVHCICVIIDLQTGESLISTCNVTLQSKPIRGFLTLKKPCNGSDAY